MPARVAQARRHREEPRADAPPGADRAVESGADPVERPANPADQSRAGLQAHAVCRARFRGLLVVRPGDLAREAESRWAGLVARRRCARTSHPSKTTGSSATVRVRTGPHGYWTSLSSSRSRTCQKYRPRPTADRPTARSRPAALGCIGARSRSRPGRRTVPASGPKSARADTRPAAAATARTGGS